VLSRPSVGLITSGTHAEEVLQSGSADIVTIARELLRNQDAVFDWAQELKCVVNVPVQYQWAYRRMMRKPVIVKQIDSSAPDLD
jgi:2,4-dienoyl-CoA reductase-like NADH-dependent reductase (Old Yellow Enzyme family)